MMCWKPLLRKLITRLCPLIFAVAIACQVQGAPPTVPPLGSTPRPGETTFRVWAPFVDAVAVKVNEGTPVSMAKEDGHPQADDTVWVADVPGAKVGNRYKYLIQSDGVTREFIDPRARQLTSPEPGASSVIVDPSPAPSPPASPPWARW